MVARSRVEGLVSRSLVLFSPLFRGPHRRGVGHRQPPPDPPNFVPREEPPEQNVAVTSQGGPSPVGQVHLFAKLWQIGFGVELHGTGHGPFPACR